MKTMILAGLIFGCSTAFASLIPNSPDPIELPGGTVQPKAYLNISLNKLVHGSYKISCHLHNPNAPQQKYPTVLWLSAWTDGGAVYINGKEVPDSSQFIVDKVDNVLVADKIISDPTTPNNNLEFYNFDDTNPITIDTCTATVIGSSQ